MSAPREPLFNVPATVLGVIVILVAAHLVRISVSTETDIGIITHLAFVPIRLTAPFAPGGVAAHIAAWTSSTDPLDASRADLARYVLTAVHTPAAPTLLTYAILHGGWAHLGLNGIWLLAFGSPTARRFGGPRFAAFLVAAAVAGSVLHWALFPFGTEPLIGASAAVSGCMGAALRFAFQPPVPGDVSGGRQPALALAAVLKDRRARSFLIVWFASNALFGIGSVQFGLSDQPVAWQAHVGGFLVGLLLFRWFDPVRPPPSAPDSEEERP